MQRRSMFKRIIGSQMVLIISISLVATLLVPTDTYAQKARTKQVSIQYVPPTNPAHEPLYKLLKEKGSLERVQELLSPLRLPRRLLMKLEGCDGVANAWYENRAVTVCYELLADLVENADSPSRPANIAREDAIIGPFVDVVLHEASHAIFDMLNVPLLGREEDAADQLAAYIMLQFPKDPARRLMLGSAFGYARELKLRNPGELRRGKRLRMEMRSFADVHGTPAQRLYNVLCIAYGADPKLFADIVDKEYLPPDRADTCEDEYRQIAYAYRRLIWPHVDRTLARAVMSERWLPDPKRPPTPRSR